MKRNGLIYDITVKKHRVLAVKANLSVSTACDCRLAKSVYFNAPWKLYYIAVEILLVYARLCIRVLGGDW